MEKWYEEWRKETIPERDHLLGETEWDNVAHLIVRGAFLDYYIADANIHAAINAWVNRTPLKETVKQMEILVQGHWSEVPWDDEIGFQISPDNNEEIAPEAVQEANSCIRSFFDELKSFPTSDVVRGVVSDIVNLVENQGLLYQWLMIELMQVYLARLFVDDFSWRYTDNLEVEAWADSQPAPKVTFEFCTEVGETVRQAVDRLKSEAEQAIDDLMRFNEDLPRGKVPKLTRATLKKYAKWFYLKNVAGKSIKSIAQDEFPDGGDRRKDVRGGIMRVEELLSLGRVG
jgi:hypothetical protein